MLMFGIRVKQAEADADSWSSQQLFMWQSQQRWQSWVLRISARATPSTNMYVLCGSNLTTMYNIHEIQRVIGDTAKHLMFLHAKTGCDTVPAIYRQGKRKEPVKTDMPVAPNSLLNMVSCGCKPDGCGNITCSCKKLGLFCSSACSKCIGQTCHNTAATSCTKCYVLASEFLNFVMTEIFW